MLVTTDVISLGSLEEASSATVQLLQGILFYPYLMFNPMTADKARTNDTTRTVGPESH